MMYLSQENTIFIEEDELIDIIYQSISAPIK